MQASARPNVPWSANRAHAPTKGPTVKGTPSPRYLIRALVLALATLMTTAAAQDTVVTEYQLDQLNTQPGQLDLSPNFLTLLEFPDLVETVATGRADLIQVEVDDNRILLRPTRGNGRTDLIVKVGGVNALFRVEIDGDNGTPRRYVVTNTKRPEPAAPQDNAATVNTMPMHQEGLGATSVNAPAAEAPATPPFEFTYSARLSSDGRLTIYYTLKNASANPIANDGTRLKVVDDLGELPYSITRMNPGGTTNRLMPNNEEHGVITAERPHFGQARVQWPVVEQGPGRTYVINELMINIQYE